MIEWLPVVGFEGRYDVSDDGRVRTYGKHSDGRTFPKKELRTWKQNGYPCVRLCNKFYFVHQLVLESFIGTRPKGMVCNHKNGKKGDNRVANLEWCTYSANAKHAFATGLAKPTKGCFKKGGTPWNAGKKTGQRPWNYIEDRSCKSDGCNGSYFCRGMCEKCHRRWRTLKQHNLLPLSPPHPSDEQ